MPYEHRKWTDPTARRIVLLAEDGQTIERVLAEPPAIDLLRELRRLAEEHRGKRLAAEWRKDGEWVPYLWIQRAAS